LAKVDGMLHRQLSEGGIPPQSSGHLIDQQVREHPTDQGASEGLRGCFKSGRPNF